jgi:multidrug efflux pump subunit AcrA (membrane-fusion protein)
MNRLKDHSARAVWIAGCMIGLLAGALLPGRLLFRSGDEIHDHADNGRDGQSWACPMLCVVLDAPGTCPVCGMDLEPFEASGTEVVLSRHDQEMIGLSISVAEERALHTTLAATGRIEFDDSGISTVSAWTSGRIESLYVRSEGQQVSYGSAVMDIYSPELYSAQQELLVLSEAGGLLGDQGMTSAEERLSLLGATDSQIRRVLQTGEARSTFPVVSPAEGTVTEVLVSEGQQVMKGQDLFRVADVSRIWLSVRLTEDQAGRIESGQEAVFRLDSRPGFIGNGIVDTVVPFMSGPGGTAEVRISLENSDGSLLPGQTAEVTFTGDGGGPVISVPRSSVLRLGRRSLVYVLTAPTVYSVNQDNTLRIEEVRFEPREVVLGELSADDAGQLFYPVLQGLHQGDVVALDGVFLIDSQAELIGLPSLLNPGGRV